jgi:hypothetical protein
VVSPSEAQTKRGETVRRESQRPIVASGVGEPVRRGPCRAKGVPRGGVVGGRQVGDSEPRVLSTKRRPVAERTQVRDETSRMR